MVGKKVQDKNEKEEKSKEKERKGMKKREMVKMARNFQCRYLWREERQRENPRE